MERCGPGRVDVGHGGRDEALAWSRSWNVDGVMVRGSIGSLKVTATSIVGCTAPAPATGFVVVMVGGVVSGGAVVENTTSTK